MANKYFLQDKRDGRVRQMSDSEIEFNDERFELIKINVKKADFDKIKSKEKKITITKDKKLKD